MEKSVFYYLFFGIVLNASFVFAQSPAKQWDLGLGGNQGDFLYYGQQTSDGGYFAVGSTDSDGGTGDVSDVTRGNTDYWVIKLNTNGTTAWDKRFGGDGNDGLRSGKQTSDGGYVIGGWTYSGISGDKTEDSRGGTDYWIIRLNSSGIKQWDYRFGGEEDDYLSDIIVTSDGGFLLGGRSSSNAFGDKTEASRGSSDYWVVKISSTGVKQWDKRFGGTSDDYLTTLVATADGGYLLGGYSSSQVSGDKTQPRVGSNDYWVVKINSVGTKQWDAVYGGSSNDVLTSMKNTTDGGFILGGYSNSPVSGSKTQASKGLNDYWILKASGTGTVQWDMTLGGNLNDDLYSLEQTSDGGYLVGGSSESGINGDKSIASRGAADYWILKLNSVGSKQWDVAFGGSDSDFLRTLKSTSDGGYAFFGYSWSGLSGDKTQSSRGSLDYWIVKTGSPVSASIATNRLSQTTFCPGVMIPVSFITAGTFGSGNVFTAQLSNSSGSFASPVNIGTLSGIYSGTISATIPASAAMGSGYKVRVIGSNPAITGTQSTSTITISTASAPVISVTGTTLTSTPAQTYQWMLNGNTLIGENGQTHEATQNGNYTVVITDQYGCSATSTSVYVTVSSSPTIITDYVSPMSFCAGDIVHVFYTASGAFNPGNIFTAQLSDGSGSFATPIAIGTLADVNSGTLQTVIPVTSAQGLAYRIRVIASDPAVTGDDNGMDLQLFTAATPIVSVNGNMLQSSPAQSYQWNLNGSQISGANSSSYTATVNGDYSVTITDNAGCKATSAVTTISSITPPVDPCGANPDYEFSLVKDIIPSYNSSSSRCFYKVADNKVFFTAKDPGTNFESLYFTDGTSTGTVMLKAKLTPLDIGNPVYSSLFCTFQGKMCFVGKENQINQVWISDGTPSGTYALTSFTTSLTINQLTVHNQKLYFKTYGGGTGALYESNGTANSAVNIETLVFAEYLSKLKTWNNKLYLITNSKVYDYTNNSRVLIFDYFIDHVGCIAGCEIVNGKLIYQSDVNCTGSGAEYRDIYEVDLQAGSERSLSSSVTFSNPVDYFRKAIVFKNAVYFYYNDYSIPNEVNDVAFIYKYDGNTLDLIHSNAIDSSDISFSGFVTNGDRLLYQIAVQSSKANTVPAGWSVLYETDGTSSSLNKIFDKTSNTFLNNNMYSPNHVVVHGNKVFFYADSLPYSSYPVSRLFYHDGISAKKIFANSNDKSFNGLEMVSLNQDEILISAYMSPRTGLGFGTEPWILTCGTTGIDETVSMNRLVVYPNPTNGIVTVNSEDKILNRINVLNLVGELILTSVNKKTIDLSQFPSGVYILEIEYESKIEKHKIVLSGR